MERTRLSDRILPVYSKGEEVFNMVSHIVGGALGIVFLVLCVVFSGVPYYYIQCLVYIMDLVQN